MQGEAPDPSRRSAAATARRHASAAAGRPDPGLARDARTGRRSSDATGSSAEHEFAAMERAARGDREAFRELFDGTCERVRALVRHLTSSAALTDELLVDVYAQAWSQRSTFDPLRGSPFSWLSTIARSRAIDRMRARSRDRAVLPDDVDWADTVRDGSESIPRTAQRGEERRHLASALAELPDERCRLLRAAFFGGLSHSEIAARTRLPLGTVKTRIRAGLAQMRDILARLEEDVLGPDDETTE
ncbi:MAG: RNA polymerase sigma factor [Planctomycetota bacterium]